MQLQGCTLKPPSRAIPTESSSVFPAAPVPSASASLPGAEVLRGARKKVKGFEENETSEMSALRLYGGCSRKPQATPPPRRRLPRSHSVGENDNSDRLAYSRRSQSTRQPLCGSQEASSSRLRCGSSANARRLLSSGKNKLQSRPILRDVIQYDSKYNLSLAVAPNLGPNPQCPIVPKRLFRFRVVLFPQPLSLFLNMQLFSEKMF